MFAVGTDKSFLFKEEDNWGVVPSQTEATNLRRVNALFDVVTEIYTSNEILGENQIRQIKHGLRNAKGSIKAELSAGTYAKLIANTIASNYSHDVDILDLSIKVTQNLTDSTTYDITRQLGSWVVDGFTAGTVVRLDGPLLGINNKLNNLYICSLTETVLTVYPLNAVELTEQPNFVYPNRCYTVGAIAYAKKTDQIDKSFSFEEHNHKLNVYELYSGNKVKAFEVNTEVKSGLPTINFELLGRDLVRKESTHYFDDASYSSNQVVSPVCTKAFIDNSLIGVMTGLTLRVERELQPNHIVGSNQSIAISESMLNVSGSFTVYFKDASLKQRYYDETTCSLTVVFADSLAKDAQVISFCLPKVVLKSKRKNDNAGMLYDTYEFTAVLNNSDTNYLLTTISIQDSAAVVDIQLPDNDPYFSYVQSLLHFNGSFQDVKLGNWVSVGSPAISNSVVKFDSGAMQLNGSSYIYKPSGAISFLTTQFTLELWVYKTTTSDVGIAFSLSGRGITVETISGRVTVGARNLIPVMMTSSELLPVSEWVHLAIVQDTAQLRLYQNGQLVAFSNSNIVFANGDFQLGAYTSVSKFFTGYIDDFRYTKDYARYSANFTPPQKEFEDQ